jgi:4'-phosphopantetheinyl transferase
MISTSFTLSTLDLELTDDEIHIWFAVLDQPESEISCFIQTLSEDELIRARRFHFQKDRDWFIARHGILRIILGCYLGVKASELQFYHGKAGKPAISETFGKGTIHFNISHSDRVALFAFARSHEIGVDIERIRDIPELELIVEQFFSEREKSIYHALPQEKKRESFFNSWARKEAFIKAIGEGLSWPLDKVDVTPVPIEGHSLLAIEGDPRGVPDWSIQTLMLASEHAGAFAINRKNFTLRSFEWMNSAAH